MIPGSTFNPYKKSEEKYSIEDIKELWYAFEKEWHMGPGYHLCAADVRHFLDFAARWDEKRRLEHD